MYIDHSDNVNHPRQLTKRKDEARKKKKKKIGKHIYAQ